MAPRSSNPTTWNEFLPISMPITAIALLRLWDMACSFVFGAPCQIRHWRGAGTRPDHPINRHIDAAFIDVEEGTDRPPRVLTDGEVVNLGGGKRVRFIDTPHTPHG